MRRTETKIPLTAIAAMLMLSVLAFGTSHAGLRVEASYSSQPVDVRVWLDRGYDDYYGDGDVEEVGDYYDVYPSEDDVVLYVRAARSCYTTVYVVDTEGFIHVIYPLSPYDNAYLVGGRVYRLWLRDYGFRRECFGRGVAFAFAVSSPVPFAYADYGLAVFGPHIGFQIYGDPFIAARLFYLSILPQGCRGGFVSVSYARFYVREYVRYPGYLCLGWCEPYGYQSYREGTCSAHREYRIHAKDPYRVLRPAGDADRESTGFTRITRTGAKDPYDVRVAENSRLNPRVSEDPRVPVVRNEQARPVVDEGNSIIGGRVRSAAATRVVRSTQDAYVAGQRNYEKMREMYQRTEGRGSRETYEKPVGQQGRVLVRSIPGKAPSGADNSTTTTVNRRAVKEAREMVALRGSVSREMRNSEKTAKRTK